MPHAIRVQSLSNFQHTEVKGDELYTSYLVEDPLELDDAKLAKIRQIALQEPALLHAAVSPQGHVAAIAVTVMVEPGRRSAPMIAEWAEAVRDDYRERYPEVDFYLSGTVVFNQALSNATAESLQTLLPLSFLATLIALYAMLRSVSGVVITMLVVNGSIIGAVGVAALLGITFQPISSYAPAIILTLGIADCIHILISYQQQLRHGLAKQAAMLESLRVNYQPVMLTSLTTAVGFLFMNTSESPPFRDMGNIVSIGVMLALALSLVLLPALAMLVPPPKVAERDSAGQLYMLRFADWLIQRWRAMLAVSLAVMLIFALGVPRNTFNDVWSLYFDESYDVRKANDFMSRELTGMHRVDYSIPARDQGGISEPEYLLALDAFKTWAEAQPEVVYAVSYADIIKRLNRNMNGADETFYRVPESRELAAQYLLMYEMSLPFGLGLDNQMSMNQDQTLFGIVLYQTDSATVLAFAKRADAWIAANFPAYMQTTATGLDLLFGEVAYRNSVSMISGTLGAFLVISLMIMFALRSVRYGLLSLLPNILPAIMAFGLWGLLSGQVGLSLSVVACLTLGIVVDDTVHFLSKYVRAKREQSLSTEAAVRYAFRTVGVALVATSIILVANFGVMAFSGFYPSSSLGTLTAITIVMALVVDMFFFAPFLLLLDRRRGGPAAAVANAGSVVTGVANTQPNP
jgi:predicted RND superfamily exporter protein